MTIKEKSQILFYCCKVSPWRLGELYICLPLFSLIYLMSIIYPPHLINIEVIVILQVFHQKSTYLRPFFLSIWHQWIFWRYTNKSDGPVGKSRCVGSSCSDSDFWALGHVRNCRVSSIVNLQCHFIWFLQCVLGFWGLSPYIQRNYIYACYLFLFFYFMSTSFL